MSYTGHHEDYDLELTDMGGRVYDPLAARFTTADPVTQAPFWSQGLNPYAYVFNDPINATDPSGYSAWSTGSTSGDIATYGAAGTAFGAVGYGIVTEVGSALWPAGGALGSAGGSAGGGALNILGTLALSPGGPPPGSTWQTAAPTAAPAPHQARVNSMGSAAGQAQPPGARVQETQRSANVSKGDFPEGNVRPGEAITDPGVRRAIRQLWRDSRSGSPYAHEEGETFSGFRRRGAGRYSRPMPWRPGVTLDEAGDSGALPTATALPLRDTPGVNVFVQVHTHPWAQGTAFDVAGVGVQHIASGPSQGDALGNFLSNQRLNSTVVDYVVTPEGIYRIFNGQTERIAPLGYLNK